MKFGKFRFGGVHPNDHKEAASIHSTYLPTPKSVLITSLQHAGAPAKIVKVKGDKVSKGDLIGEASGYVSANIHASVDGTVTSIDVAPQPLGRNSNAVLITSDLNASNIAYQENKDYMSYPTEVMLKKIKDAGIVGLGGAMFPTHVKIEGAIKSNCDVLLINGVECEPYITSDYRLMLENTEELFNAIDIIRKIVPSIKRTVIGIEANKPLAVKEMETIAKEKNVEVMTLKLCYPQGAEKMLIDAATGRVVPVGKFPPDIGVLVSNVATLFAIYEAVCKDKPLIERLVTVSGNAIKEVKNLWVPIGTPISALIENCGGLTSEKVLVIAGGPMMGFSLPNLEQTTIKGTNAIVVLDEAHTKKEKEYQCIKCGKCSKACPVLLSPTDIAHSAKAGVKEKLDGLGISNCFECGCCAYVCPSKIPLVQWIRVGKDLLRR